MCNYLIHVASNPCGLYQLNIHISRLVFTLIKHSALYFNHYSNNYSSFAKVCQSIARVQDYKFRTFVCTCINFGVQLSEDDFNSRMLTKNKKKTKKQKTNKQTNKQKTNKPVEKRLYCFQLNASYN